MQNHLMFSTSKWAKGSLLPINLYTFSLVILTAPYMQLAYWRLYSEPMKVMPSQSLQRALRESPICKIQLKVPGRVFDWNPLLMYWSLIQLHQQQKHQWNSLSLSFGPTLNILTIRSIKYCFFFSESQGPKAVSHASNLLPLWKNTMMPQDQSVGEISWHILTYYLLENSPSPLAYGLPDLSFRQKGFFTIIKLLLELVLSWLSIISLLPGDKLAKETLLDTAKGIAQITWRHLNLTIFPQLSQTTVTLLGRLSTVITWCFSLNILLIEHLSLLSILQMNFWIIKAVPPFTKQLASWPNSPKNSLMIPPSFDLAFLVNTSCILLSAQPMHSECSKNPSKISITSLCCGGIFYCRNWRRLSLSYFRSISLASGVVILRLEQMTSLYLSEMESMRSTIFLIRGEYSGCSISSLWLQVLYNPTQVVCPQLCCSLKLIPNYLQSYLRTKCLYQIQVAPFSTIASLILSMFYLTQETLLASSNPPIEIDPILPPIDD